MFVRNCTLRRTPIEEPIDIWNYIHGDEAKFGLLMVTNPSEIDEYNVNVELNLRYGSSIGHVDEAQVKIKQNFRFIWIPLSLVIGSKDIANTNNDLPDNKGVIKVVVSKKLKNKNNDPIAFKDPFKSIIGKISSREKPSDNHLIIYQNVNISPTLILKTKVINDIHLLVLENASTRNCTVFKVKSEFETLFSHSLQLLPTERFSLILDPKKIKSDILWVSWSLDFIENIQSPKKNLWSPVQIIITESNKLRISCSNLNIINGVAIIDIMIYNNTLDDMDVQLLMGRNDSLVALQDNYIVGFIKSQGKGCCRVEFIVIRRGIQQLPNIKLVDKLGNKSYLLSGAVFQF